MNTLTDIARSAVFRDGQIVVAMESGAEVRLAVANPRLAAGTPDQLNHIELSPFGWTGLTSMRIFLFADSCGAIAASGLSKRRQDHRR